MNDMAARTAPEDGDIVIQHQECDGGRVFALRAMPRPEQILVRSRDEAVRQGIAFARREGVRVWVTDERTGFVLLEDFRVAKSGLNE
jgi:hypothetical protein